MDATAQQFIKQVADAAAKYDLEDTADLSYNLFELGRIHLEMTVETAAHVVAQHLLQA